MDPGLHGVNGGEWHVVGRGEHLWKMQHLLSFPVSKSWPKVEEGSQVEDKNPLERKGQHEDHAWGCHW